jgi:hypothetical protein
MAGAGQRRGDGGASPTWTPGPGAWLALCLAVLAVSGAAIVYALSFDIATVRRVGGLQAGWVWLPFLLMFPACAASAGYLRLVRPPGIVDEILRWWPTYLLAPLVLAVFVGALAVGQCDSGPGNPEIDGGRYVAVSHGHVTPLTETEYWRYSACQMRGFSDVSGSLGLIFATPLALLVLCRATAGR